MEWVDTRLKLCDGNLHGYLKLTDGIGYGFYATSHIGGNEATFLDDVLATFLWYTGVVKNDDHIVYKDAPCKQIEANDCCLDVDCYVKKVEEWVRRDAATYNFQTNNRRRYNVIVNNCYTWRNRAAALYLYGAAYGPDISSCKKSWWDCHWINKGSYHYLRTQ